MLVINIELWPGGRESAKHVIAQAKVGNSSDLADTSDYSISAAEGRNPVAGTPAWLGRGRVDEHDRNQSVWALVAKVAAWAAGEAKRQAKEKARARLAELGISNDLKRVLDQIPDVPPDSGDEIV